MKKFIALFLVLAMLFSFAACGNDDKVDKPEKDDTENVEKEKDDSVLIEKGGVIYIKYEKFGELLERIELTTENWKDYIKVSAYEEETVNRDAFGEIVSTETRTGYCIGAGNERYHQFQDAIIELKNKETGELTIYSLDGRYNEGALSRYLTESINLDDYECTRIKGRLYFVDLPEEAILSPVTDWGYENGFILYSRGSSEPYEIDMSTKFIHRNGGTSWDDAFSLQ